LQRFHSKNSGACAILKDQWGLALHPILQGPEVRSGDLPQPILLKKGDPFTFTIRRGVGTDTCVSVNYDDFVNDVESGDTLLIDGTISGATSL
jgi:pyruvate kinase